MTDIQVGDQVKDRYGNTMIVLDIFDNIVWTTGGIYRLTKVWKIS